MESQGWSVCHTLVQGSLARDLQVSWKLLLGWASQLPFALPIPGGSSLPCLLFLIRWKLPELMVTTWMLPVWMSLFTHLHGAPAGGALKTTLGGCLAHHSDAHLGRSLLGILIQCGCHGTHGTRGSSNSGIEGGLTWS